MSPTNIPVIAIGDPSSAGILCGFQVIRGPENLWKSCEVTGEDGILLNSSLSSFMNSPVIRQTHIVEELVDERRSGLNIFGASLTEVNLRLRKKKVWG